MSDFVEFPIEYQNEIPGLSDGLQTEAEERLLAITTNHKDMTGAAVMVDQTAAANTPSNFRVRIVVYMRQQNVVSVKEDDTAEGAMKAALKAVERQVRETRDKFNETWKRPDIEDQPPLEDKGRQTDDEGPLMDEDVRRTNEEGLLMDDDGRPAIDDLWTTKGE